MATNIVRYLNNQPTLAVAVSHPAAPSEGDPVRFGGLAGIALTAEGEGGNAATETTVWFGPAVVSVSAKAVNDGGNSAIAVGDLLYYVDADTPVISKKATGGIFFGIATSVLASSETGTVKVMLTGAPGVSITVNDQNTRSVSIDVPSASAADASAILKSVFVAAEAITITGVSFIPATVQAGADTDSATLALRNIGAAGAGTDVIADYEQTSGNDFAAHVPADFGSAIINEAVTAGDVLAWHRTKVGTGVDSPAGQLVIEYEVG